MSRPHRIGRLAMLFSVTVLVGTACGARTSDAGGSQPVQPTPLPVLIKMAGNGVAAAGAADDLGVDLLSSVGSQNDNLVVSPVSVALALQMLEVGAKGATVDQMGHVLHGADPAAGAALARSLATVEKDQTNTLRLANTAWAQRGMPIESGFSNTLSTAFGSPMRQADFESNPQQVTDQINRTVAGQTNGMIPHLFPDGSLDTSTRLVLTNAVYLAASWAQAFDPKLTTQGSFTTGNGSVVRVPMMHVNPDTESDTQPAYGYASVPASGTTPGYQAVTLPYTGGKMAFTILLPNGNSLAPLMNVLRSQGFGLVLHQIKPTQVDISMPKFTIRSNVDLTDTLAELGMPDAFTGKADFSGITTAQRLTIQTVQHDAMVQVDEHGTTAAAATGVGMVTSAVVRPQVTVNHPFLFIITDTATGAPLFLGRVTNPGN